MDTAQSRMYDADQGSMNSGSWYTPPNDTPADQPLPVGSQVTHAKSGESGTVTGYLDHPHSGERLPTVRWEGQPALGAAPDQGYSLTSLTGPTGNNG
jgi:hypothetical protein